MMSSWVTHTDLKWFSPYRFLGLGEWAFSLILGMVCLTHEPGLMSLLVHLFFNIWHLTPSVVLKYKQPISSSLTTWFSSYAALLHLTPYPLTPPEGVCIFLDSGLVDRKYPIYLVCWVFNLVFFFSLSLSLMIFAVSPELYLSDRSTYLHHLPPSVNCFFHTSADLLYAINMIYWVMPQWF